MMMKTIYNKEHVRQEEQKAVDNMADILTSFMPNVTDLEGEQLDGAMKAIKRYQEMIKKLVNRDDA